MPGGSTSSTVAGVQSVQRTGTARPSYASTSTPDAPSLAALRQKLRQIQRIGSVSSAGSGASRGRSRRSEPDAPRARDGDVEDAPLLLLGCALPLGLDPLEPRAVHGAAPQAGEPQTDAAVLGDPELAVVVAAVLAQVGTQTTGNSSPLARCTVIIRTASSASASSGASPSRAWIRSRSATASMKPRRSRPSSASNSRAIRISLRTFAMRRAPPGSASRWRS